MVEVSKSKFTNRHLEFESIKIIEQKVIVYLFVEQEYFFGSPGT